MHPVVVSDLDGTLLNEKHELASRTKNVIRRLNEQGIKFVFATGRHHLDVENFRSQVGIDMYTITSNGARVLNPEGDIIIRHDIESEHIKGLVDLGRKYSEKVFANIYTEAQWLVEQEYPKLLEFHKDTNFVYQLQDFDTIPTDKVIKVFFCADEHEDLLPLEAELREQFDGLVSISFSLPLCLEVVAFNVNKGCALKEVLSLKGFEEKDAVAFGDGMNDLEMLQTVGKGMIMNNGLPELKARLPELEVIGHHNDDAVAEYLESQYFN